MRAPVKVIEIELSEPLRDLDQLDGYSEIYGIVCYHTTPVGTIHIPLSSPHCSASTFGQAIAEQLAWPVVRKHLIDQLDTPSPAEGFQLDQVFEASPTRYAGPLPLITVAVCTRNRTDDLAHCLEHLMQLDYPQLDRIVIDNAPSSDATERLVRERFPDIRYAREDTPGLDWARNRAILEARGEIVAYTDDDVMVDAQWARAIGEVFAENPHVMAVTGLVLPYELETEPQVQFEQYGGFGRGTIRRWFGVNAAGGERAANGHANAGRFGTGANMAYRRSVFEQIGPFDPALDVGTVTNGGGDLEMFFRVLKEGFMLVYEPRAMVRHRHRRDTQRFHTQIANNGVGFYSFLVRCFLAYPEERLGILRMGIWWFWYWSILRLLKSFVRPQVIPRSLNYAEARGSLIGLRTYQQARQTAARYTNGLAPLRQMRRAPERPRHPHGIAVREIDICQPLQPITDLADYPDTRLYVFRAGQPIGFVQIANRYQPIGISQLREELVNQLDINLIARLPDEDDAAAWNRLFRAIHQRWNPTESTPAAATMPLANDETVSIIVATCDRPNELRACLQSLSNQQTNHQIEIIVVDNHPSSGKTAPVVAEFPSIRLIHEERSGSSYARNAGIAASSGSIIVTTDDDVIAPPEWLDLLIAPLHNQQVMVVTGNVLPQQMDTQPQRVFEHTGGAGRGFRPWTASPSWLHRKHQQGLPIWELGGMTNAAFRASVFANKQIGMLEEALGPGTATGAGEDIYTFYRVLKAGYDIVYQPSAFVYQNQLGTMAGLRRQIFNTSKGRVAFYVLVALRERDLRGLKHTGWAFPIWQARRLLRALRDTIRGRAQYPLSLMLLEVYGTLLGPFSLMQSLKRVQQLGRSRRYTPITQGTSFQPIPSSPQAERMMSEPKL